MITSQQSMSNLKAVGDVGAAAITLSAVMQWAPAIAAVFTALYAIFRLYEAVHNHLKKNNYWPFKDK